MRQDKQVIAFITMANLDVDALLRLGAVIEEMGLNEHDVIIRCKNGTPVLTINFEESVTDRQAELAIKSLVTCLMQSGVYRNPMTAWIHPSVARAHRYGLH